MKYWLIVFLHATNAISPGIHVGTYDTMDLCMAEAKSTANNRAVVPNIGDTVDYLCVGSNIQN